MTGEYRPDADCARGTRSGCPGRDRVPSPVPSFVSSPVPIRVVAAVARRGDRLLVCQRPAHKRHGGLWEFPGGKVEPGEDDAAALRRELHEELGVAVTAVGPEAFAHHDAGSPFLIAFIPVEIEGEPACHEHQALAWATLAELAAMALAPTDRAYVGFAGRLAG